MGRKEEKKRAFSGGRPGGPTKKKKQTEDRWAVEISQALGILTEWDDVADSELTAALLQLPTSLRLRREARGDAAFDGCEQVVRALERACGHARSEVRATAWEALRDCCLEEPPMRGAAVAAGLHSLAWSQLRAAAAAAADAPLGGVGGLLGFIQACCELAEGDEGDEGSASPEEAVVRSLGEDELRAVVSASGASASGETRRAALELLLVLTDPAAGEDGDEGEGEEGGDGRAGLRNLGGDADGESVAAALGRMPEWAEAVRTALAARKSTPAAEAEVAASASASASAAAAASEPEAAAGSAAGAAPPAGWPVRVLAASLALNVCISCASLGLGAESLDQLLLLATGSLSCLADAVRASCDATPPPPDDALRAALEALTNYFVCVGDAAAEGGSPAEPPPPLPSPRLLQPLLPGGDGGGDSGAASLLPPLLGALARFAAPAKADGGKAGSSKAGGSEGSSSAEGVAAAELDTGVAGRLMRCTGALLSCSADGCGPMELAAALCSTWSAALEAASALRQLAGPAQAELLDLLALLASRSADAADAAYAQSAPPQEVVAMVRSIGAAAVGWPSAAAASAASSAVGLLGQLLGLARRCGADGALEPEIGEIGGEIVRWMSTGDGLCAAEAVAALAEDAEALAAGGEGAPLVEPAVLSKAVATLRDNAKLRKGASRGNPRALHALELVDAAAEACAGREA